MDADCALYNCRQGQRSKVDYLREFKARVDTINESGSRAGWSLAAAKLVAKELNLDYNLDDGNKKSELMTTARTR